MKTLNQNKWSVDLVKTPLNGKRSSRPRIGDDDGISDRAMNAVIILFMLITMGLAFTASAQAPDSVQCRIILRQAMLDMEREQYDQAVTKLLEVRANTPENANVCQMLGRCYLYGYNDAEKAVFYLTRATGHVSTLFEEWDMDESRAPIETAYHLAKAQEMLGNYAEAANSYEEFLTYLQQDSRSGSRMYAMIGQNATRCRTAAVQELDDATDQNVVFNK